MAEWSLPPERSTGAADEPSARILEWPGPRAGGFPVGDAGRAGHEPGGRARRGPRATALVAAAVVPVLWALSCIAPAMPVPVLDRLVSVAAASSVLAVVPAVALVAAAIHARARVVAIVTAAVALLPWIFVAGYAAPGQPVGAGTRVATMVLDADAGRADAASLVAAVGRQRIDVLVVTEATPLLAHELTTAGLDPGLAARWVSLPGATEGGVLVYSRLPVTSIQQVPGTRWPAARITLATGRGTIGLVTGRAASPGSDTAGWRADLRTLGAATRTGTPSVLAATLDATPTQPAFRALASGGLADAAAVQGRGLRPTWPSWSLVPVLPLDHVLVGGGVGVRSVTTDVVAGTSHRALVADLVVPASRG